MICNSNINDGLNYRVAHDTTMIERCSHFILKGNISYQLQLVDFELQFDFPLCSRNRCYDSSSRDRPGK